MRGQDGKCTFDKEKAKKKRGRMGESFSKASMKCQGTKINDQKGSIREVETSKKANCSPGGQSGGVRDSEATRGPMYVG